jgi:hypothetical protein
VTRPAEVKELKMRNARRGGAGCFFSGGEIADLQGRRELIF